MKFHYEKNIIVIRLKDLGNQAQRQAFAKRASSIKTKFRENVPCYGQVMLLFLKDHCSFMPQNPKNTATRRK